MSETALEGGCRCGALRFRISAPPLLASACHCKGCQRMTGGPFSLTLTCRRDAFAVTAGETAVAGLRGPQAHHHHCPLCMSWVFTEIEGFDQLVNVRTTMLDTPPAAPPFVEICAAEKLPWAETGARHSFPQFPEMAEFGALMAEFASLPAATKE